MASLIWAAALALSAQTAPTSAPRTPSEPVSRIAFGSCYNQAKPAPIWATIAAARPHLTLMLGDNAYIDSDDPATFDRIYDQVAADPGFALLRSQSRMIATWDDHDYGKNDGGEEFPARDMALAKFDDFWQVSAEERATPGVYASHLFPQGGRTVQVIVLDTRYFRSPLIRIDGAYRPDDSADKTMLGEAQWKWLEAQFRTPADLRIVMSSIQFVPEDHIYEKWANLPRERQRMLDLIKSTEAEGVLFVSGDRHLGEISMMDGGVGYPIYDVTGSGFNQSRTDWRLQEPNRHRVQSVNYLHNFGWIEIDWKQEDPLIKLQLRGEDGDVLAYQPIRLSWLKRGRIRTQ